MFGWTKKLDEIRLAVSGVRDCHTHEARWADDDRKLLLRIEEKIDAIDKRVHYNDKLLETIVQLAMVEKGMGREAMGHQQVSTVLPQVDEDWDAEAEDDADWTILKETGNGTS